MKLLKLIQGASTRWNRTFYMFQRFITLENAVKSTIRLLDERLPSLSSEEWRVIKEVCEILKYFEEATNCVSGENYVWASLVTVLNRVLLNVCETFQAEKLENKLCLEVSKSLEI